MTRDLRRLRGRMARTQSIGTKLHADEERQLLAAEAKGKICANGHVICCCAAQSLASRGEMEMHIFTELVGIQMLLMNALDPLLRGEKMTQEQLAALLSPCPDDQGHASPRTPGQARSEQGEMTMATVQQWGRKESIIWPPRGYVYTLGAFIFACILAGLFIYIRFQYGLSPLQRYYLPYYLRTETAGLTHPVSQYQLLYVSDGEKAGASSPGQRRTAGLHSPIRRQAVASDAYSRGGEAWRRFI